MMAAREPLALGQELIQVSTPPRRVLAASQPMGVGCVKDPLDAATKAGCGFWFGIPQRLEDREHIIGTDFVYGQMAQRSRIALQCHLPLCSVLLVAPRRAHGLDNPVGTVAKARSFQPRSNVLGIYALSQIATCLSREFAG